MATELHKAGNSFRDVGKWLGVRASTVRQYLIRAGIEPRERSYNQKLWMLDLLKGATYPPS